MNAEAWAREMFDQCLADEQSARRIPDDGLAAQIRADVRQLARAAGVRIRTARMSDAVVVVRLDASVWSDDAATMRRKLTPPG